jgi:hypothetical protein
MTSQHPDDFRGYDDAELDALLDVAMTGILTTLENGFNQQAGLADIYRRLGVSGGQPDSRPIGTSARLQEVCDQIDALNAYLTAASEAAQANPFAGAAYLDTARPDLLHLRAGLASRDISRTEAERLLDTVHTNLAQAERITRAQHGIPLDEVLHTRLGGAVDLNGPLLTHLQDLHQMVIRLYDDAGYTTSLTPAR